MLFRSTDYLAKWGSDERGAQAVNRVAGDVEQVVGVATGMFMLHDQVLHPRGTEAEASMPEYQR